MFRAFSLIGLVLLNNFHVGGTLKEQIFQPLLTSIWDPLNRPCSLCHG